MGSLFSQNVDSDPEKVINPNDMLSQTNPSNTSAMPDPGNQVDLKSSNITNTTNFKNDQVSHQTDDDFTFSLFGYDVKPFQWIHWSAISPWLSYLSSVGMVVGCVLPYVPQYWTIHKTRMSSGFSTLVCLALLVANITRVSFWFGKMFDIALLVQSAVMIIAQLMLLEICIRMKRSTGKRKTFFNSNIKNFWAWSDFLSYIEFLILFSIIIGTSTYFLKENIYFVEIMGYFSLLTESMLAMPQLVKNFAKKSVVGLSVGMVLLWTLGDAYKLGYFICMDQPFQFWLCGMLQITIDIIILIQICVFTQKKSHTNPLYAMESLVKT